MGRVGHGKRITGSHGIAGQHGSDKILIKAFKLFRQGDAEKAKFAGLVDKVSHQPFLLAVDPVENGKYFGFEKILAGLNDHLLLLIHVFRDEDVFCPGFLDEEFPTAFYFILFHDLYLFEPAKI